MIEYSKILKNKTTIITGSNRGIGKSIVENFAFHGSNIIACSRKFDKNVEKFNKSIQEKFKIKIDNNFFDLFNKDEIKKFNLDRNEK